MARPLFIPLLAVCLSFFGTEAFRPARFGFCPRPTASFCKNTSLWSTPPTEKALSSGGTNEAAKEGQEKESSDTFSGLVFSGRSEYATDAVPMTSKDKLKDFMSDINHMKILLSGKDGNKVVPIELSQELLSLWKKETTRLEGAITPEANDPAFTVVAPGVSFPGVTVQSETVMGTKVLEDAKGYQFTLIRSEQKAQGVKPLVWLFNKLTGADKEKKDGGSAHCLTELTTEILPNKNELMFKWKSGLTIEVGFPRILLKLLPVSKEKAEEQGSESLKKALDKEGPPALENFRRSYLDFISN